MSKILTKIGKKKGNGKIGGKRAKVTITGSGLSNSGSWTEPVRYINILDHTKLL